MARRLSRPRQLGRDLLVEVGARTPEEIDPIETAKELGIEVTFGNLSGATARIYRIGDKARIRVSDQIVTAGRRRMSIMHEIGHYLLGHALASEDDPVSWLTTSCARRNKSDEREADILAVEHLMPEPMARPFCSITPVDLRGVRAIERAFTASPVMSAMRLAELSPERCAVVYSERARVKWMKPSRTFPGFLAKGSELACGSHAASYFASGAIDDAPRTKHAAAWFGSQTRLAADVEIVEHAAVVPEPGWGGVMSLLWIPRLAVQTA